MQRASPSGDDERCLNGRSNVFGRHDTGLLLQERSEGISVTFCYCTVILLGYGSGSKKWIMHLQGGGWCVTEDECVKRSKTNLGSSKDYPETRTFHGLLSASETINPDFYNWNMVYVAYCDGVSFLGNV